MRNKVLKFLVLSGSIIAAVVILGILALLLIPQPPAPPTPTTPNEYTTFVDAGQMISKDYFNIPNASEQDLRTQVDKNAHALQFVRSNLTATSWVPLDFYATNMDAHLPNLARFKALAYAFLAEGKLAEMQQHPAEAAKSYLDTIEFGIQSQRGGTLIDALVGLAIESIGAENLQKLATNLDATTCRNSAAELETLDQQRQTWDQVIQQEHYWSSKAFPGLQNQLARLMTRSSMKKVEASGEKKFKTRQMNTEKLMLRLAARAYELENGHEPTNAADLVPAYLKAIPQDPLTGRNLTSLP